jgi:parvulin-like peptidyl-prolyl isomerase
MILREATMRCNLSLFALAGLVIFGAAGLVAAAAGFASDLPPGDTSPLVATWPGGGVTVNELVTWWDYGLSADRSALTTLDGKEAFLNTVINAKLMIDEAESLGLTRLPTVADFYRGRRVSLTNEKVFNRATTGRINVTDRAVDEVYRKRLTEMDLSQIVVPKQDLAQALTDSIKAGVPFGDLARRYSTAPTAESGGKIPAVRWGDFTDRFSAEAFRLEAGQVSEPFPAGTGWCILRMDAKTLKEPPDPAAEKQTIRARLERDAALNERSGYLDSLKTAYNFTIDVPAVVTLSARYAVAIEKAGQQEAAVLDADIIPELSATDRATPVITYRGGSFTMGEVADLMAGTPFQVRPRVDDPDELIPFITGKASDSLVFAEGVKLGLDREPDVTAVVDRAKRRKTLFAFYSHISRDAAVTDADARAYYEAHSAEYNVQEGSVLSKIVVGTMEAADSVLQRLDKGEAFEVIARARSRDPFTATEGGNVGFLRKGEDEEFDGFLATMQPGERKAFRSLEGVVVLWLREKHVPRKASFDEARAAIDQVLLQQRKDEIIEKWAAERRAQTSVVINRDVLAGVVLK